MWLPLNTEFYEGYSTEDDANATENDAYTTVYDTVSIRVINHLGRDQGPLRKSDYILELQYKFVRYDSDDTTNLSTTQ